MSNPLAVFAKSGKFARRKVSEAGPAFWFTATVVGAIFATFLITRRVYLAPGEDDSPRASFERRLAPPRVAAGPAPASAPSSIDYVLQMPTDTPLAAEGPTPSPDPPPGEVAQRPEQTPLKSSPPRETSPKPPLQPMARSASTASSAVQFAAPATIQKEDPGVDQQAKLGKEAQVASQARPLDPEKRKHLRAIMLKIQEHIRHNKIDMTSVQQYKLEKTVGDLLEAGYSSSTIMLSGNIYTWIDGVVPYSGSDKLTSCTPGTLGCGQKGTLGD